MKKITVILSLLLIGLLFSCKNENSINEPENFSDVIDYSVFDYSSAMEGLQIASLENDPKFDGPKWDTKKRFFIHKFHPGHQLFKVLKNLKLDSSQKDQIKNLIEQHKGISKPLFEELHLLIEPYIKVAKDNRKLIVDKVKSGEITKEAAKPLIEAINLELRNSIYTDATISAVRIQLCNARQSLFEEIALILSTDQKVKWEEWVASLPKDCN